MGIYIWLKVVHVLAVVIWVGGITTIAILANLFSRDAVAMGVLGRGMIAAGRAALMPGSIIALITGIAMLVVTGGKPPFWMLWGLIAGPGSGVIGGVFIRRTAMELVAVLASGDAGTARAEALRNRFKMLTTLNVLLLLSAVLLMVLKPRF
ncbi:MAG: hypothetical protein ABIV28_07635 [Longimicrobiales bacterium]